jgi:UDP-2-acetamido-2-deoxy-ribo-hexuluronate aminotransferase
MFLLTSVQTQVARSGCGRDESFRCARRGRFDLRQYPVMEFVDLKAQYRRLKPRIDARLHAVLDHGRFILGPEVQELEARLASRVGAHHAIGCASGTDALLLALMALGVGPGDEVITSPFTFFATGEMTTLLGATPVFVDIEPVAYNIDPAQIEAAITPRTRAILPVSLYGQPAEMDAIDEIAARHNLPVVEDAAQSFGALYKGRHSGNLSTIGCTSFFPSKPLGCYGDGGACFTSDDALAQAMFELRNHGQAARYLHTRIGVNGRLDTLQAAVLLAKLDIFDEELIARCEAADRYTALLKDAVHTPRVLPGRTSAWAQYTIEVDDRDAVEKSLHAAGIPTAVHYPMPLHLQPVYAPLGLERGRYPVAERVAERVLSLPMHPYLEPEEIERVCNAVKNAVRVPAAR